MLLSCRPLVGWGLMVGYTRHHPPHNYHFCTPRRHLLTPLFNGGFMQEIQAHVIELGKQSNKSYAQIAREAGLSETTVRRFFAGEDSSVNTLVAIASVVGANDLTEYLPAKTAMAMEIVKQEIESEFKPHSPHCSTDCTARKGFNENLAQMVALYEKRLGEHKELYERAIAEKNDRIKRFRIASYILLGLFAFAVAFVFYLIFIDFANPAWGIFQYPTALWEKWQDVVPQAFRM